MLFVLERNTKYGFH